MSWEDVPPIGIVPNWSSPYKTSFAFSTKIFTATSGDENRIALRETWLRRVSYSGIVSGGNLRKLHSLLTLRRDNRMIIPDIPRSIPLLASPVNQTLSVSEIPDWVFFDMSLFLYEGGHVQHLVVESAVNGAIRTTEPIEAGFSGRAKLAPGLHCRLQDGFKLQIITDQVATGSFDFEVEPGSLDVLPSFDPAQFPARFFHGIEYLDHPPNWRESVGFIYNVENEEVYFGDGRKTVFFDAVFNTQDKDYVFTFRDRVQAMDFLGLFQRSRGRQGAFYIRDAVSSVKYTSAVGFNLTLADPDDFYGDQVDEVNRALAFRVDGTWRMAGIANVSVTSGGNKVITLDQKASDLGLPSEGTACSVNMARFSDDVVTMEWMTDSVAECRVRFRTVRDGFFELAIAGHRITLGQDYLVMSEGQQYDITPEDEHLSIGGQRLMIGQNYLKVAP